MATNNNETTVKDLEKKLKTMFQAMQRMEKILKATEAKASRAIDLARKNTFEVAKIQMSIRRREE